MFRLIYIFHQDLKNKVKIFEKNEEINKKENRELNNEIKVLTDRLACIHESNLPDDEKVEDEHEQFKNLIGMALNIEKNMPGVISLLEKVSQKLETSSVEAITKINGLILASTKSMEEVIESISRDLSTNLDLVNINSANIDPEDKLTNIKLQYEHIMENNIKDILKRVNTIKEKNKSDFNKMEGIKDKVLDIKSFSSDIISIAEKTHVLAINAKIEAARLQKYSGGFGVVAGEVGLLSIDSMKTANRIHDEIRELTDYVESVILGIENDMIIEKEFFDAVISLMDNIFSPAVDHLIHLSSEIDKTIGKSSNFNESMNDVVYSLQFSDINYQAITHTKKILSYLQENIGKMNLSKEFLDKVRRLPANINTLFEDIPIDVSVGDEREEEDEVTFF